MPAPVGSASFKKLEKVKPPALKTATKKTTFARDKSPAVQISGSRKNSNLRGSRTSGIAANSPQKAPSKLNLMVAKHHKMMNLQQEQARSEAKNTYYPTVKKVKKVKQASIMKAE